MKKKRYRFIALMGALMLGICGCANMEDSQDSQEVLQVTPGTPSYVDDKEMEIGAYGGPRRSGYRYWNGVYGEHPEDPEGGWEGWITEEAFQDYMDCGFTYLMPEYDAAYDRNTKQSRKAKNFKDSDLYAYMELAEKMQIPVVIYDGQLMQYTSSADYRLSEDQKEYLANMVEDLSAYKMFKGFTLRDEPSIVHAKTFGAVTEYLNSLKPDAFYYTSLLPIYCNDFTKFSEENTSDRELAYKDYIDTFSDEIGTFVYDSYPLWKDPVRGTTSLDATWFQNLRLVAENAKEKDYDTGITIQSCAFGSTGAQDTSQHKRAITSKADVTFQLYTSMAYGMKHFSYFTYWEHWSEGEAEDFYTAMVEYPEKNGQEPVKTDAYYAVKDANWEIKKFDHVYLNFDWVGTFALTGDVKVLSSALQMAGDYKDPRIAAASATDDAIIGCLKDADGYDGYMIVNATDPGQNLSNSVTVEFKEATKALAYIQGEETTITLDKGTYTFELGAGEGVFVIPIQ